PWPTAGTVESVEPPDDSNPTSVLVYLGPSSRSSTQETGSMAARTPRSQGRKSPRSKGKSMFVKEVLNDNPRANAAAVNEAWRAAGMTGSISSGLVNHLRFRMGLSGNLRRRRTTGRRRGRRAVLVQARANRSTPTFASRKTTELMSLEV